MDSTLYFADAWLTLCLLALLLLWTTWKLTHFAGFNKSSVTRSQSRKGALKTGAGLLFSSVRRLRLIAPSWPLRMRRLLQASRLLTLILLAVALGRPQTGRKKRQVTTQGVDIMLALDTSGSMQALDLDADRPLRKRRNRLQVVRSVVEDFVHKRESDQIGLVVFGTDAYTQCPLTLDHGIVATFLKGTEIGMAGEATALGDALGTAVKRLKKSQAKSKVIILLTDGRQTAGGLSPLKAAEVAKAFGIKVYTVGAGTRGKAPYLIDNPLFGKQVQYQESDIDETTLMKIAELTDGAYFRAEDTTALANVYKKIDSMERTEIKTHTYMEYEERYAWFVWPALLMLLIEVLALNTRLRKLP